MTARYLIGDVYDRMDEIPDGSVDLVATSPPFLALRSYLPDGHPNKGREIGSEATPADFLDTLLALTAEWGRVLAPHGSLCVELGDTYSGSGGDYNAGGLREGQQTFRQQRNRSRDTRPGREGTSTATTPRPEQGGGAGWPMAKSLTGIPTLYAWSLAYGRNLLTGEPSPAGRWRIRNMIVWARPNPPVGALGDKFRPATSYITVATRASDRWFDLDAVRVPGNAYHRHGEKRGTRKAAMTPDGGGYNHLPGSEVMTTHPAGAPPLDWHADEHPEDGDWLWRLPTAPYKGAHYATFPKALPKRLIEAMCPRQVCTECGEPRKRVLAALTLDAYRSSTRPQTVRAVEMADAAGLTDDHIRAVAARGISEGGKAAHVSTGNGKNAPEVQALADEAKAVLGGYVREFTQTTTAQRESGWTTCDCADPEYRSGLVLDPFAGSGTTLEVATGLGRDAIGIDIDERNADLARERVGMFLEVDEPAEANR